MKIKNLMLDNEKQADKGRAVKIQTYFEIVTKCKIIEIHPLDLRPGGFPRKSEK